MVAGREVVRLIDLRAFCRHPLSATNEDTAMTDRQRSDIRDHLQRELDSLRRAAIMGGYEPCADENEFASRLAEMALSVTLLHRAEHRIGLLENALRRLEAYDYGVCEGCGEDIPVARLKASPATRLCVFCQQESECAPVAATGGERLTGRV